MYEVKCVSSGITVARFTERQRAIWWAEDNNTINGEYAKLFTVVKSKT